MTPFVQALLQICVEENSTASIETIRNNAFGKLQSGEMKTLISSSLNGKSFSFNVSKPADQLFADCSEAIRLFQDGKMTATEVDFSSI